MIWFSRANRRRATWAVGLALTAAVVGCTSKTLSVSESDVVVTFEDEDRDYSELKTFFLPDRVVDLCEAAMGGASGDDTEPDCFEASHDLDATIIAELRSQMEDLGYREIEDPDEETPDVAFFLGSVAQNNWYLTTSPGYCYDYYYYWWYGGCWFPGYSYAYNLPTGTILVEMAALDEEEQKASSAWTAILRGLYVSSSEDTGKQRVRAAIQRAFDQSPYLSAGGEK